ncbi:MAG: hypothetical protein JWN17_2001, partial [Frankiales bacterium]|nr:hypothetical protein [Frankiales bacterium]
VLAAAGDRASTRAPLARLALEPEVADGSASAFPLRLTVWPGGSTRVVARAKGHGPPVTWA